LGVFGGYGQAMTAWKWFWLSMALLLVSVFFCRGWMDDVAYLRLAAYGKEPGWAVWHSWGFLKYRELVYHLADHNIYLWRLSILPFSIMGSSVLAYTFRESKWAVMSMACVPWMEQIYAMNHGLRYDGITLLVTALCLWWVARSRRPGPGFAIGLLSGLCITVTFQGAFIFPAMLLTIILGYCHFKPMAVLVYVLGLEIGWSLTLQFYPWHKWFTFIYSAAGQADPAMSPSALLHPSHLIQRMFLISDFGLFHNGYAGAWWFIPWMVLVIWKARTSLSCLFASCFMLSYGLICLSYYPNITYPIVIAALIDGYAL
jgi:hypothetical protein